MYFALKICINDGNIDSYHISEIHNSKFNFSHNFNYMTVLLYISFISVPLLCKAVCSHVHIYS